jgi:hypothetical protein
LSDKTEENHENPQTGLPVAQSTLTPGMLETKAYSDTVTTYFTKVESNMWESPYIQLFSTDSVHLTCNKITC